MISEYRNIGENCKIGENVNFLGNVDIGDNCKIGNNVCLNSVHIDHNSVIQDNSIIGYDTITGHYYEQEKMKKSKNSSDEPQFHIIIGKNVLIRSGVVIYFDVNIGNNCWINHNAIIRENVNISENNQINLDYAAQDDVAIAIGETIELDPFWIMKSGDNYGNNTHAREWSVGLTTSAYPNTGSPPDRLGCGGRLSLHTNGGNLGDEGVGDGTNVYYPRNYIGSWYSWNGCRVATANWDITAIPTTAEIKDVNMHLMVNTSSAASTGTCEFNQITQRPDGTALASFPTGSNLSVSSSTF